MAPTTGNMNQVPAPIALPSAITKTRYGTSSRTVHAARGAVVGPPIAERIRVAVDALPPEQREALMLAYFGGKTYRQVAEVLEIPEGTAKSRLRLALHRIADALEAEGILS